MNPLERAIHKLLRPLRQRINGLLVRGLMRAIDDSANIQRLQVSTLSGELSDGVERFSEFGFNSHPPRGTNCIVVHLGGSRGHPVVIACEHPGTRIKNLAEGESVQYNAQGDFIHVKANGEIHVKASSKVLVDAPEAEFTGNITVAGNATIGGNVAITGTMHSANYDAHTHPGGGPPNQ